MKCPEGRKGAAILWAAIAAGIAASLTALAVAQADDATMITPAMKIEQSAPSSQARLSFCDEFERLDVRSDRGGTWDTSYYWQETPNGSTLPSEQQWYIDASFGPTQTIQAHQIHNGVLTLRADRADPALVGFLNGHAYTSGLINSGRSFGQTFGYFEMRAKLPKGQGLWPAFWLVPEDGTASHEIDVMEVLGQDTTKIHTTLHQFKGSHRYVSGESRVPDMAEGFHLFGVDWQSDTITWYFDRVPIYRLDTPTDLRKPMFMIINLAAGGPMPGPIGTDTQFPADMLIDYVRVYSSLPRMPASSLPAVGSAHCPSGLSPKGRPSNMTVTAQARKG